jgi:hypothetical protein
VLVGALSPKVVSSHGDVMLVQKIALETDERGALAVANKFLCQQQADELCLSKAASESTDSLFRP